MSDRLVFLVLGTAVTFFLAAINFRLGVLNELRKDFKEFREKVFKLFVTKENCDLTRKACTKERVEN